ncbi:hypothetical protein [Scopulibacillus cellulosilyticus]|uniref:Uncharacterized protein n=1 Tax=Scopulibacillus cellulosilyticus TaxID=2665665 RepID=A0ABW2PW53_9BACL
MSVKANKELVRRFYETIEQENMRHLTISAIKTLYFIRKLISRFLV